MSIRVMTAVWEKSRATEGALLVNLAMADFAHDDGSGVYPSVHTLAEKARLSDRQVQRILRQLEALGEIAVTDPGGRGRRSTARYTLTPGGDKMSPLQGPKTADRVTPTSSKGDADVTRTIMNRQDQKTMAARPADPLFDAVAEVCGADPATSGSSIGKVTAVLKQAKYTPAEVLAFKTWWWGDKKMRQRPPTVWQLKDQIGVVRTPEGKKLIPKDPRSLPTPSAAPAFIPPHSRFKCPTCSGYIDQHPDGCPFAEEAK
jgi:hypothetical protein